VLLSWPGARGAPYGDEARPNYRRLMMYMAANDFYLAYKRSGRSFFVAPSARLPIASKARDGLEVRHSKEEANAWRRALVQLVGERAARGGAMIADQATV
jgi:hypothetical protein